MATEKANGEFVTSSPKTVLERTLGLTLHYLGDVQKSVSSHRVGQFMFQKAEDAIWVIEKSIEWAGPPKPKKVAKPKSTAAHSTVPEADQSKDSQDLNGSHPVGKRRVGEASTSARPLPWIMFIPVLATWRATQLVYEVTSSLLGRNPIQPEQVVSFLRNRRRDLRAARIQGKRMSAAMPVQTSGLLSTFVSYLLSFSAKRPANLGTERDTSRKENKKDLEIDQESSAGDDQETVFNKLNRLGEHEDDTDEDPDFEPDSSSDTEDTSSSDADIAEDDQPSPKAGVFRVSRTPSFIADDIIHEENEDSVDPDEENSTTLLDSTQNGHPRGSSISTETDDTISDKYSEALSLSMSSKNSDAISAK